jgi:hypothetical protein
MVRLEETRVLKVVGLKRRRGQWLLTFIRRDGRTVVATSAELWTARKTIERELLEPGGVPFGGSAQVAELAAAMIKQRLHGGPPVAVGRDTPSGDVLAAFRIVETMLDERPPPR